MAVLLVGLVLLGVCCFVLPKLKSRTTPAPLPPGPSGKPIVGNIADLPPRGVREWEHWGTFKDRYGPISSISVFGTTMIIINDSRIAFDLFEKRSSTFSDRPRMVFAGEMCGWKDILVGRMYDHQFKLYRRNIHAILGSRAAVSNFDELHEIEVRRFAFRILETPGRLIQHIRTCVVIIASFSATLRHPSAKLVPSY